MPRSPWQRDPLERALRQLQAGRWLGSHYMHMPSWLDPSGITPERAITGQGQSAPRRCPWPLPSQRPQGRRSRLPWIPAWHMQNNSDVAQSSWSQQGRMRCGKIICNVKHYRIVCVERTQRYLGAAEQLLEARHHRCEPVLVLRAILRPALQVSMIVERLCCPFQLPNAACAAGSATQKGPRAPSGW